MPWLPIYLYGEDASALQGMLNKDPEAAFLISDGPSRWRAVATVEKLPRRRYAIWHVPSGPLPLLGPTGAQPVDWIDDPWQGWQELRSGHDTLNPYFGAGYPGMVWLNLKNEAGGSEGEIRLSSFEWIGHRYDVLGNRASAETDRWWKRLGAAIRRNTNKVPRGGLAEPTPPEIYAFPEAHRQLELGLSAVDNP